MLGTPSEQTENESDATGLTADREDEVDSSSMETTSESTRRDQNNV